MKLYKLSILALALAGTMAACSDDNDYSAPASVPGAFFPSSSPDVVELPFDSNSVDITVRRNSNIDQDQTFKLTVSDPSGLFNIPTSVTFVGQELTSQLHVTFDPDKIVTDKDYPAEIKIDGQANPWGITDYKFSFNRATPLTITDLGIGTYEYAAYIEGWSTNEVQLQVNQNNPNIETYVVNNWFDTDNNGVELKLIVHKDQILPNGYPYVEMNWTKVNYVNPNYAAIKIISQLDFVIFRYGLTFEEIRDNFGYNVSLTNGTVLLTAETVSYFDTDRGTFHMYNAAGAFDDQDTYLGGWSPEWEYLYLPGYPDYDVQLGYLGYFTNEDEEITAVGELYAGEDVETVDLYNIVGEDVEDAIAMIANGSLEPDQSISPESTDAIRVTFPVAGAGTYTMIAVAYGDGEVQGYDYATYTIAGSAPVAGNWESVGQGVYIDGWVMPAYTASGVQVNPYNYPFYVDVEKNLDVEGEYRMVSPYTSENYPLLSMNENSKAKNIVFNIADPDWPTVAFQASGFSDGNMEWISDFNWFAENVSGLTKGQILGSQYASRASYYESGTLTVVYPLFAMSDGGAFSSSLDDLGYNWRGPGYSEENPSVPPYPAELTMPTASRGVTAAKAIRKAVSGDNFINNAKAFNQRMKIEKANSRDAKPHLRNGLQFMQAEASPLR